jgi:hypothetical protein
MLSDSLATCSPPRSIRAPGSSDPARRLKQAFDRLSPENRRFASGVIQSYSAPGRRPNDPRRFLHARLKRSLDNWSHRDNPAITSGRMSELTLLAWLWDALCDVDATLAEFDGPEVLIHLDRLIGKRSTAEVLREAGFQREHVADIHASELSRRYVRSTPFLHRLGHAPRQGGNNRTRGSKRGGAKSSRGSPSDDDDGGEPGEINSLLPLRGPISPARIGGAV